MAAAARRPAPAWPRAFLLPLAWAPCRAMQLSWPDAPLPREGPARAARTPRQVEAVLARLDAEAEADQAEADQRLMRLFAASAARTWRLPDGDWAGAPQRSPEEAMGQEDERTAGAGPQEADGAEAQASPEEAMREEQAAMGPAESPEEAMNEEEEEEEVDKGKGPARSMLLGPPAREAVEGPGRQSPEEAMHDEEGYAAAPSSPEEAMHQEEEGAPAEYGNPLGETADELRTSQRDAEESSATALACSSAFSGYDAVCDGLEWAGGQCAFVVATRGATCSDYCREQGSECLAAADNAGNDCTVNPDPQGRAGAPTTASFCLARFSSQICACRPRGPPGAEAPPAPAAPRAAAAGPWAEDDRVRAEVDRAVREAERAERELQDLEAEAQRVQAEREAGEARSAAKGLRRLERTGGGGEEPLLEDEGGAAAAVRGPTEEEPKPQPPREAEFSRYGPAGGGCVTQGEPLFAGAVPSGRAECEDRCAINPLCRFYSYAEESHHCRLTSQCNGTAQPAGNGPAQPAGPPATVYYRHDDSEQATAIQKSLQESAGPESARGGHADGGEGRAAAEAAEEAAGGARGRANRTFEKLKSVGQALGAMNVVPRVSEGAWDKLGTIWGEVSEALAVAHKEHEVGSLVAELKDMLGKEQEEGAPDARRREATAPAPGAADARRLAP